MHGHAGPVLCLLVSHAQGGAPMNNSASRPQLLCAKSQAVCLTKLPLSPAELINFLCRPCWWTLSGCLLRSPINTLASCICLSTFTAPLRQWQQRVGKGCQCTVRHRSLPFIMFQLVPPSLSMCWPVSVLPLMGVDKRIRESAIPRYVSKSCTDGERVTRCSKDEGWDYRCDA